MAEYKKTWDLFFAYHQPGQAVDVEELRMCVGNNVAFAVAITRCGSATVSGPPVPGGFQFRLTIGLCRVEGAWRIQDEHHSVPATDQKNQSGDCLRRYFELLYRHAIRRGKETA